MDMLQDCLFVKHWPQMVQVPTGFFCDSNFADPFDLLLFLIAAIFGGTLGALFNQVVEHLSHLRLHRKFISNRSVVELLSFSSEANRKSR